LTKREERFFEVARQVSLTSTYGRIKIGAIIVNKKQIVSVGTNAYKSHPLQKRLNRFRKIDITKLKHNIHAEISAILRSNEESLSGAHIFVYREDLNHALANCRPCAACMAEIKHAGIKRIYYTTKDGYCCEDLRYDDDILFDIS
jgi:deoxycytidylate deaminase